MPDRLSRRQLRLVRFAYSGPTATWPLGGPSFGVSAANVGPPSGPLPAGTDDNPTVTPDAEHGEASTGPLDSRRAA